MGHAHLAVADHPAGICGQLEGRGLLPRFSIGTLQLSIRCSSIHFLPRRSFPVRDGGISAGEMVTASGVTWPSGLSCAKAADAELMAKSEAIKALQNDPMTGLRKPLASD